VSANSVPAKVDVVSARLYRQVVDSPLVHHAADTSVLVVSNISRLGGHRHLCDNPRQPDSRALRPPLHQPTTTGIHSPKSAKVAPQSTVTLYSPGGRPTRFVKAVIIRHRSALPRRSRHSSPELSLSQPAALPDPVEHVPIRSDVFTCGAAAATPTVKPTASKHTTNTHAHNTRSAYHYRPLAIQSASATDT